MDICADPYRERESMNVQSSVPGLLDAARAGDPSAFASLVQPRSASLFALVHRLAGPHVRSADGSVEDMLQEAMLRAWRLLPDADGLEATDFPRWIAAVVRNVVRDRIDYVGRRTRMRHLESSDGAEDYLAAAMSTITQVVAKRDQIRHALDALDSLPLTQREVVEAHLLASRTLADIAGELGISRNAVWERLQRGLSAMRQHMDLGSSV